MRKYYIHDGQSEIGPLEIEQLKTMQIKNETPVWYNGLQNWTTANNVEELKSILSLTAFPPKFDNFGQQNINATPPTPSFKNSNIESQKETKPKEKNILGNILFGIGVIGAIFIVGAMIFGSSNTEPTYNENGEFVGNDITSQNSEKDRINAELTEKNRNYRNNFEKYIHVSTNKYTYDEFGGISNLDVIVTNDTDYMLNQVDVNIDYIKDNGDVFKSEIVTINNIPAHQDKSASAPESNRGTSVQVRMDAITSKKMHFCFYATNGIGTTAEPVNSNDPYFCK